MTHGAVLLQLPTRRFWCPYCTTTVAKAIPAHTVEAHHCPGLFGLFVPMFEAGERGHLITVEREDYTNGDKITTDARGRAIMAVHKMVGNDQKHLTVYAPSGQARMDLEEVEHLCPPEIRRQGRDTMRRWVFDRLMRRPTTPIR